MDGGFQAQISGATCDRLDTGARYEVRRHRIDPGATLAPCAHLHRTEHWIVVQGTARLTRNGEARLYSEGQSFPIPQGQVHSLDNPGRIPVVLIDVWTGGYLAEDDLVFAPALPT
jgi:mannose-6-phosphate isomerase-like protein (cupin superfamily)